MIKEMNEIELEERLMQLVQHINIGPKQKWGVNYDSKVPTADLPIDQDHIDRFYRHAKYLLAYGLLYLPIPTRERIMKELVVVQ